MGAAQGARGPSFPSKPRRQVLPRQVGLSHNTPKNGGGRTTPPPQSPGTVGQAAKAHGMAGERSGERSQFLTLDIRPCRPDEADRALSLTARARRKAIAKARRLRDEDRLM